MLGGEAAPDAELMAPSTVPAGVAAEALAYLRRGRPGQPARAAGSCPTRCCSPARASTRRPRCRPTASGAGRAGADGRPTVGVVFYRAHELSGNTGFVDTLCDAIEAAGANALPVFCGSLRGWPTTRPLLRAARPASTRWSSPCWPPAARAADAAAGGDEDAWDVGALAASTSR